MSRAITHVLIGHCADGCGAIRTCMSRESATSTLTRSDKKEVAEMIALGMKVETVTMQEFNAKWRQAFGHCRMESESSTPQEKPQ